MPRLNTLAVITTFLATAALAMPASADYCIQLNGGSFSGDLGFFRFKDTEPLPHIKGTIKTLTGRVAGLSPAFGTLTVAKDGSFIELGATFFADATQGQFDIYLSPPRYTSGSGYADYGTYGVNQSVTATVVRCSTEP